jgi:hypothetical protein
LAKKIVAHTMASSSDDSGLLGSALATLDIPTTARLAGISMTTDDDGTTKWTVTFVDKPSYHVINKHTNHTPVVQPVVKPHNGELHRLFPLRCDAKTYAWGRKGEASLVATLKRSTDSDFEVGEETPYAELWMGTHPSGPSLVTLQEPWHTTTPLAEMLKLNPQLSGGTPKTGLPYLFKILSVRTALSIQAHPDKALARKLHAKRPDMYKDDNHKPEMAIAISKFECEPRRSNRRPGDAAPAECGQLVCACAAPPASGPPELRFTCVLCFSPWQGAVLLPRG